MTLVVVAVVVVVALTIGLAVTSVRTRRHTARPSPIPDAWLDEARCVVRDGYGLAARMAEPAAQAPDGLLDDELTRIVSEFEDFNTHLATISATAPTAMDTRVCREVGVRARALGDVYERELRLREAFGTEHRSALAGDTLQQPTKRLDEFEVALRDLDEHVELL